MTHKKYWIRKYFLKESSLTFPSETDGVVTFNARLRTEIIYIMTAY